MSNVPKRGAHFKSGDRPQAKSRPTSRAQAMHSHQVSANTQARMHRAGTTRKQREGTAQGTSKKPILLTALILILVAGIIALVALLVIPRAMGSKTQTETQSLADGTEVHVVIPDGASGNQVAQLLYDNKLISSAKDFLTEVNRQDAGAKIKPGKYVFYAGQDANSIVKLLVAGPNDLGDKLTIPEGYTVAKIADAVYATYGIARDEFITQAKASSYVADFPFLSAAQDDSLEGFLYPKTYSWTETPTADQIIRAMLNQYQKEMQQFNLDEARARIKQAYGLDMSDYDFLKMASIIEKEAKTDEQRPIIADVFYKRMRDGINLQSDATQYYYIGPEFSAEDLKVDSPWNTYTRAGLPETPIASPSEASIKAALEPEAREYYYFYIDGDYEAFSKTYEEHQQAIENAPK